MRIKVSHSTEAWDIVDYYVSVAIDVVAGYRGVEYVMRPVLSGDMNEGKEYYTLRYEFTDGGRCWVELGYYDRDEGTLYLYEDEELIDAGTCDYT